MLAAQFDTIGEKWHWPNLDWGLMSSQGLQKHKMAHFVLQMRKPIGLSNLLEIQQIFTAHKIAHNRVMGFSKTSRSVLLE